MIGTTISHYRVLDRLGEGGMSEVFLAEDTRLHRQVALKVLRARGRDTSEQARLFNEARAASALNHPNIAVIYDVEVNETPDGPVYLLAMEYVPGRTLDEMAKESLLSIEEVIDVTAQVCDGLAEAHERGVVHRDIKPSNLMVAHGRVKILDFGLARQSPNIAPDATTWTRVSHEDGVSGTLHYMSPEQTLGKTLDARSDVFSLGVVLYELLAGKRPFEGENLMQVADAILHREVPPVVAHASDPRLPDLERLVARMLAKRPENRIASLRDVSAQLHRLRAGVIDTPLNGTPRLAIVGFANLTPHGEDQWLGTGLNETVTAALEEIDGIDVWGREQLRENLRKLGVESAEVASEDAVKIGRMAGARWVMAGAFQRVGEQVRVTARVLEVSSERVLQSIKTDGRLDDIFELQDRIVAELTSALRLKAAEAQEGDDTQVLAAYEALSKGLINVRADSYESLERAILFFERALALDPHYVRAQVELGAALEQKGEYLNSTDVLERARQVLRRLVDARPRFARAWRELGITMLALGRTDDGIDCLQRALALDPEDPRVLGGMARGYFIGRADFPAAAVIYRRAVERNPEAGWYWLQLSHCLALTRELEPAALAARRAIELQEGFFSGQQGVHMVGAYMRLGHVLFLQKKFREAADAFASELAFIERLDHALRSRIRVELFMRQGAALVAMGERERAETAFTNGLDAFAARVTFGADEPLTHYYAGAIHALRGEVDPAVAALARALEANTAFVIARARIEPEWDSVRDDARFARLVQPVH
jgi:TolB-like protein/Tfp pilus assembly protein PilF/predicted Ser/Thr protein kinase